MLHDLKTRLPTILRDFGLRGGLLLFALVLAQTATAQSPPYDLLLRNARIVDGSGGQAYRGDVAISGDTIVGVAPMIEGRAARVIDVGGQVLAPGFIDVHTHVRCGAEFSRPRPRTIMCGKG